MQINGIDVEDTYCEAFDGLFSRIIVTAKNERYLKRAVLGATALPSTVVGRTEGGIEKWLDEDETPDKRKGAIVQVWANYKKNVSKFEYEYSLRIRQGVLVVPTTRIFNAMDSLDSSGVIDTMDRVGHCGDGHEWVENRFGREVINIPLMMGEFLIERYLGYAKGVMGGNVWFMCKSGDAALKAGEAAVEAVGRIDGAVTSFDVCSAGSKVETNYKEIGPTTNHPYCPTLKGKIKDSRVPEGVESIPEIVINGVSLDSVKEAMKAAIEGAAGIDGVIKILAGNYGGKLGKYKIYLKELI
jgi:formylmethanofuran--tetrahydromethanopterin N-formyltransferase